MQLGRDESKVATKMTLKNKTSHGKTNTRAGSQQNMFRSYAENKGVDQPVHPRSLIRAFVSYELTT